MSLRDELATMLEPHFAIMSVAFPEKPIDRNAHVEKWVRFIERALAAERAAFASVHVPVLVSDDAGTHMECEGCAWNSKVAAWEEHANHKEDRSALDALLAQARAEQRKKDASYLEWLAAQWTPASHPHAVLKQAAAAIRGQKD